MRKFKLLVQFLHGSGKIYIFAIISVLLMSVFSALSPLIIRFTVDSVIGREPADLPFALNSAVERMGGMEFIRTNLWVIFAAIVAITLLQGGFMYLKGKLSAVAAQASSKRMRDRLYDHLMRLPFD